MTRALSEVALEASSRFKEINGKAILVDFMSLLQIPNVTGQVGDLRVNAVELARRFEARGASMEVIELPEASPIVVGELRTDSPTATLGVYVHYDGQPIDPSEWAVPPFSATLLSRAIHQGGMPVDLDDPEIDIDPEWRIYARGASDDKTPFAALTAALDALSAADLDRRVDLVFLFEGEEESGSPNLDRYMTHLADRLRADAWLLCDGPIHQTRLPQVAFGVRGYTGFDLTVYGPERELHSGHYGNWVPNPAMELARFLASCKDDEGMVSIVGFYDSTLPLTDADHAAIAALPAVEEGLRDDLGFGRAEVEFGSYAERLMIPSFNVRGVRSAAVGPDARNVIPAEATASVDIRLAAGDDPERMLDLVQAHLESAGFTVLDRDPTPEERRAHSKLARLDKFPGYRAARVSMESPLAMILLGASRLAVGGEVVALPTFGGSVPLYQFEEILGAPVVVLPIANHDNNQHSADENIRVGNLWYGIDLWATLLTADFSTTSERHHQS